MEAIWNEAVEILAQGGRFVLAAVVGREGSSPRAVGTIMLIREDGGTVSTVGGGDIEARVLDAAKKMLDAGGWEKLSFDLKSDAAAKAGMVCGGTTEVFLGVCSSVDSPVFEAARSRERGNKKGYLAFHLDGKGHRLVFEDDMAAPADSANTVRIPMCGNGTLYIFGAGHVAVATARIAAMADFKTTVFDDRAEFANAARFPDASVVVLDSFESLPYIHVDANCYIVIATRGHFHDATVLDYALGTDAGYIGMIGSRRKREITYRDMASRGHSRESLDRVFSPIGLAIGSETPAEIAVSIVGELILVRSGAGKQPAGNVCS